MLIDSIADFESSNKRKLGSRRKGDEKNLCAEGRGNPLEFIPGNNAYLKSADHCGEGPSPRHGRLGI